jgi:hypothetical protein
MTTRGGKDMVDPEKASAHPDPTQADDQGSVDQVGLQSVDASGSNGQPEGTDSLELADGADMQVWLSFLSAC